MSWTCHSVASDFSFSGSCLKQCWTGFSSFTVPGRSRHSSLAESLLFCDYTVSIVKSKCFSAMYRTAVRRVNILKKWKENFRLSVRFSLCRSVLLISVLTSIFTPSWMIFPYCRVCYIFQVSGLEMPRSRAR